MSRCNVLSADAHWTRTVVDTRKRVRMPGGRLTDQDRERIAAGLAEGLGYAEMARQLARPTSTISREVTRNGGPAGYRADQAHQATERRARRSNHTSPPEPLDAVDAYGRDPVAVRGFAEQFVAMMVQMGLPRMASRVLTCLYTTDSGSLTAAELVHRLRISPASVSKAVSYLEGLEMLRRERDPRRRERYIVDDDVWDRAWSVSAKTNSMWADAAQSGVEIFDIATPAGARLDHMGQFLARLSDDMPGGPGAMDDAMTVLAALVYAKEPIAKEDLATALDWPMERVTSALSDAMDHPNIADPLALQSVDPGVYTVTIRTDRLSAVQRDALSR